MDEYRGKRCEAFRFDVATSIYLIRSYLALLVRLNLWFVVLSSIATTCLCYFYDWTFELPLPLLSAMVMFPLSFGVQYTMQRRERVLLDIASLKASAFALYSISKEWPPPHAKTTRQASLKLNDDGGEFHLETNEGEYCEIMKQLLSDLLHEISIYVSHRDSPTHSQIYNIYARFDQLFNFLEDIRTSSPWITSVISRAHQYVRFLVNDFEKIREVADYRTPSTFRAFGFVTLSLFPLFFAPVFAKIGVDNADISMALYACIITTIIMMTFNNIMLDLEDPFDEIGVDDLSLSVLTEPILLMYKPITNHRKDNLRVSQIFKWDTDRDTSMKDRIQRRAVSEAEARNLKNISIDTNSDPTLDNSKTDKKNPFTL